MFTTTNYVVIDHMFREFATDFASKVDFEAYLDQNTRDHYCIIIDNNPNVRGKDRYYNYVAPSDDKWKPFVMCPNSVWKGDRHKLIAEQRKKFRKAPKYSKAYLERMFYEGKVLAEEVAGSTDRFRLATEFDFRKVVN